MPQCFSLCLLTVIVKGPKQSIPVEKNADLNSCSLAWGRSAIRSTAGLALHLWQSKQECCCFLTAALPRRIQYLWRSSAKTHSEPGWQSWLSMSWMSSCITLWAGSSTTGWIVSEFSWSLRQSRPPTRMSWNTVIFRCKGDQKARWRYWSTSC